MRRPEDYEKLEKLRFAIVDEMKAGLSVWGDYRGAKTLVARQVAKKLGVSYPTVMRTWKNYREKGEQGIKLKPIPSGPPPRLTPEQVKKLIQVAFKQRPPRGYRWWTYRLMQKEARIRFGVKCDPATIQRAMVKHGWSLLKIRRKLTESKFLMRLAKRSH
jgi:transposase